MIVFINVCFIITATWPRSSLIAPMPTGPGAKKIPIAAATILRVACGIAFPKRILPLSGRWAFVI
jgi:hypothetical protein